MKGLFFIFLLSALSFCKTPDKQKHSANKKEKLSTKEKEITFTQVLNAYTVEPSSVSFKRDSVIILHRLSQGTQKLYYQYDWYKVQDKLEWGYLEQKNDTLSFFHDIEYLSKSQGEKKRVGMKRWPVYFPDITRPAISYTTGNPAIADSVKENSTTCDKVLVQKSGDYYYFVCKGLSRYVFIYDSVKRSTYKLGINPTVSVREFFLYDITGDSRPEIILFMNSPFVRKNEGVVIEVYSAG